MKEQRKIVLGGETVSYTLERKAVKNINLRLRPDTGLSVSAPKYVALSQVERVLMQHQQKILETLRQYQTAAAERRQQYPRSFSTGETVLYLGKYCTLEVLRGSRECVQVQGDKLLLLVKHPEDAQCRERVVQQLVGDQLQKRRCAISAGRSIRCLRRKAWRFRRSGFAGWSLSGETAARLVAC